VVSFSWRDEVVAGKGSPTAVPIVSNLESLFASSGYPPFAVGRPAGSPYAGRNFVRWYKST